MLKWDQCEFCFLYYLDYIVDSHYLWIYKFAYQLKFTCNDSTDKINTCCTFAVMCRTVKNLSRLMRTVPSWAATCLSQRMRTLRRVQHSERSPAGGQVCESQLWHLLVGWPQASHFIPLNLIYKIEFTRRSFQDLRL